MKREISSDENWKECFLETALCSVNSSHRFTDFPTRSLSLRMFLWNIQSHIWKPIEGCGEKEISSDKNWKEAFWETTLCSVNSSYRITAFPSRSRSVRLFLWNLQSDIWKPIEDHGVKEISSDKNWKVAFWEIALCSVNSSHRITAFPSRKLSLKLFLWNLEKGIWKTIEIYG